MDRVVDTSRAPSPNSDESLNETLNETLKVFISYSRDDMAFADELVGGLEYDGGFEVTIDRHAIHEGEDWKIRLGALIAEADTIVFILTPKSATSPICQWEVEEAVRMSKRILPVQALPLDGVTPPKELGRLNYVRFDPVDDGRPRSFMDGLKGLRRALNTDINWLREHNRLLGRALEWDAANRAENRLLLGSDIETAKDWLERQPKDAPPPTELHHDFISASEQAQTTRLSDERKRAETLERAVTRTRWLLAGAVVLALAAGAAGFFAKTQGDLAITKAEEAEKSETRTKKVTATAQFTQSGLLAKAASELTDWKLGRDAGTALLLALEGLPDTSSSDESRSNWKYAPKARVALGNALRNIRERATLKGHTDWVASARFSPDGQRIITASGDRPPGSGTAKPALKSPCLQGPYEPGPERIGSARMAPASSPPALTGPPGSGTAKPALKSPCSRDIRAWSRAPGSARMATAS